MARRRNSNHRQEYAGDDVGADNNTMEDNINNPLGRFSLNSAADKKFEGRASTKTKKNSMSRGKVFLMTWLWSM